MTRLHWLTGSLHLYVFGFTREVSIADSISSLLPHINKRPTVTVFLDPEKPSNWRVLTLSSLLSRERGSEEEHWPGSGTNSTTTVPESGSRKSSPPTRS